MIGIYQIENQINGKVYIGQSRDIEKRWQSHLLATYKSNWPSYNYPLYQAMRKYSPENFTFVVLEECLVVELNTRESFWIKQAQSNLSHLGYNQTMGSDYQHPWQKITPKILEQITLLLLASEKTNLEIANQFAIHPDTVRDINVGRTWKRDNIDYPIKKSPYNARLLLDKERPICSVCGKNYISRGSKQCVDCGYLSQRKVKDRPSKLELAAMVSSNGFEAVGRRYGVNGNTVKKWCKQYNIPHLKNELVKWFHQNSSND